ncbi:MAG: hypothetical protein KF760_20920 [Candidatus Eremiobacteraeota bacterium]|nr:hypothetical protein [Candidatus Eremiobacteraeota bacterium]MCW5871161.1 hypothetical protein [Candidatus Eremiobacteraeota bacterium]
MAQLRQLIQNALQQAPPLDPDRQPVIARLELLTIQADNLSRGAGDWNVFFRFYQETQAVIARSGPLPGSLGANWTQIQQAVSDIGRQQGRSLGIVGQAYAATDSLHLSPELVQRAMAAVQAIESSLGPAPGGAEGKRFQQARAQLAALRTHLQSALSHPKSLGQILHDRRRFQVIRSALQLPPARFSELDQALDQLPDP